MSEIYNNEAISFYTIAETMRKMKSVSNAKFLLIYPMLSTDRLVAFINRSKIRSIEELLIKKGTFLSNFNETYLESMPISINTLIILCEAKILEHKDGQISYIGPENLCCEQFCSSRLKKILKATDNVTNILSESTEKLYLQLKVII